MKRIVLPIFSLFLAVGALAAPNTNPAAHAPASPSLAAPPITKRPIIRASESDSLASAAMTPEESSALRFAGRELIRQSRLAEKAVARKDTVSAAEHVEQALTLSRIIDRSMPRLKTTTVIESGDLKYTDGVSSREHILTLRSSDQEVAFLHRRSSAQGAKPVEPVTSGYPAPEVVTTVDDVTTSTTLDVSAAHDALVAARTALDNKDIAGAAKDLSRIVAAVTNEQLVVSEPLVAAEDNLDIARDFFTARKPFEAKAALMMAGDELNSFAKMDESVRGELAHGLSLKVDHLAQHMSTNQGKNVAEVSTLRAQIDDVID